LTRSSKSNLKDFTQNSMPMPSRTFNGLSHILNQIFCNHITQLWRQIHPLWASYFKFFPSLVKKLTSLLLFQSSVREPKKQTINIFNFGGVSMNSDI